MDHFHPILPLDRRFDDRTLRAEEGDDGSDFERFVYETLSLARPDLGELFPGFGRSRDGAIDMVSSGEAGLTVMSGRRPVGKSVFLL